MFAGTYLLSNLAPVCGDVNMKFDLCSENGVVGSKSTTVDHNKSAALPLR